MIEPVLRYLAGFVDADGSFFVYCANSRAEHPWYVPEINVTNTNRDVPEAFARLFGGKVHPKGKPKGNRRQAYQWVVQFNKARLAAAALRPYLIIKPRQAEIIRDWPSRRGVRPPATFEAQTRLYREIKALNHRPVTEETEETD